MTKNSSLKDLVSSVDWGKIMENSDVRNAVIGSALGGLVLGGASLMRDRDPEESKFVPVGDALLGAALGGFAGYGIPKAVELFGDAGKLAPDNDRLEYNYPRNAVIGGGIGVGLGGAGIVTTLAREANALERAARTPESGSTHTRSYNEKLREIADAQRRHEPSSVIAKLQRELDMNDVLNDAGIAKSDRTLARLEADLRRARGTPAASAIATELKDLRALRRERMRGYTSFFDLIRRIGQHGNTIRTRDGSGIAHAVIHPLRWLKSIPFSARNYHGGHIYGFKFLPRMSPGMRMGLRAGKAGLIGAGLGMLAHWLSGPSSRDNFKKD